MKLLRDIDHLPLWLVDDATLNARDHTPDNRSDDDHMDDDSQHDEATGEVASVFMRFRSVAVAVGNDEGDHRKGEGCQEGNERTSRSRGEHVGRGDEM